MLKGGLVLIWELDMNLGPTLMYTWSVRKYGTHIHIPFKIAKFR